MGEHTAQLGFGGWPALVARRRRYAPGEPQFRSVLGRSFARLTCDRRASTTRAAIAVVEEVDGDPMGEVPRARRWLRCVTFRA